MLKLRDKYRTKLLEVANQKINKIIQEANSSNGVLHLYIEEPFNYIGTIGRITTLYVNPIDDSYVFDVYYGEYTLYDKTLDLLSIDELEVIAFAKEVEYSSSDYEDSIIIKLE